MQLTTTIDTAIVLFTLYLGLSLVVSHFNEIIQSFLKKRGTTLYSGILNLLCGARDFADAIMLHPMIASTQEDKTGAINPNEDYRPSYIDARSFSTALWQSVAVAAYPGQPGAAATISFTDIIAAPTTFIASLRAKAAEVPNAGLRVQLFALLDASQGDYNKLLAATDDWFNRQMDRVSGWYQRYSRMVSGIMAFIIVALCGIDSFHIADTVYHQSAVTAAAAPVTGAFGGASAPAPSATPNPAQTQAVVTLLTSDDLVAATFQPIWSAKWTPRYFGGMLITFLAALLGAPFWFDLLSQVANVRLAGPKPDTSAQPSQK